MNFLFWLSIALWLMTLVAYALILSGNEQLQRKDAGISVFIPFRKLFHSSGHSRSLKYLYPALVLSAIGAIVTGGLYLLTGI